MATPVMHAGRATAANPVLRGNYPDPGALHVGDSQVVVASTGMRGGGAFPLHLSDDAGLTWRDAGVAIPKVPAWWGRPVESGWGERDFWAPEIHAANGTFLLYYAARHASGSLCIGVGRSMSGGPLGPYNDPLGKPLVRGELGQIDPTYYRDPATGRSYLIWKVDGNAAGRPTPIMLQQLSADGLSLVGSNSTLLEGANATWEGALVEAPWLVRDGSYYYLFYSANAYYDARYAIGVARARAIEGPYERRAHPALRTDADAANPFAGPGHCSVLRAADGSAYALYHAWLRDGHGKVIGKFGRQMLRDEVRFDTADRWPTIGRGVPGYVNGTRAAARVRHAL